MWSRFSKFMLEQVLKRDEFTCTFPSLNCSDIWLAIDIYLEISMRGALMPDCTDVQA